MSTTRELTPEEIQALLAKLHDVTSVWEDLNRAEQAYAMTMSARCPVCKRVEFRRYDEKRQRLKHFCSLACSNASRAEKKEWLCVLCRKRLGSKYGLEKHIEIMHKDHDLHSYLRAYYEFKGWDVELLQRYCPHCRKECKPDLGLGRYRDCRCVLAARKVERKKEILAQTQDRESRTRIQRQIAGCKSLIAKYRGSAGRRKIASKLPKIPAIESAPAIIVSAWGDGLVEIGTHFRGILNQHRPLYELFYQMLHYLRSLKTLVSEKNSELIGKLRASGWQEQWPSAESGPAIFITAFRDTCTDFSKPDFTVFSWPIAIPRERIIRLTDSMRMDENKVAEHAQEHEDLFEFPLNPGALQVLQCWHRYALTIEGKLATPFNPMVLYGIYKVSHPVKNSPMGPR